MVVVICELKENTVITKYETAAVNKIDIEFTFTLIIMLPTTLMLIIMLKLILC